MSDLFYWGIAIVLYIGQHILSRRVSPYWGAIIPSAFLVFMIVILAKDHFHDMKGGILATIGGLAIACGVWAVGRDSFHKKRRKELDKIELENIK